MLKEVRQAIADAVSASLPDIQCSPYQLANPTPPGAHLFPASIDYDQAMSRGMDTWLFTLQVFVADVGDVGAQVFIDKMVEPSGQYSIKEAVELDVTLGGLVFDVDVSSFNGFRRYVREAGEPMLGAEWTLTVRADGG